MNNIRQQLQLEFKNAPSDVVLVGSSASDSLSRVERLGESRKVLDCNNLKGHLPQYTEEHKAENVYVLAKAGHPLMPCKPAKARKLLKAGKASVVRKYPFTIQLKFECENETQDITVGVDPGYKNIGFSAISESRELISGEIELENGVTDRLKEKAMYRRGRRNRHHWYRPPRFMNRGGDKKGWLPPSVQRRLDIHVMLIKKLKEILPITKVNIEVANFDIQKIKNPEINGVDYQRGDLYGYKNMQSYLFARERGKCQLCGKEYKKNDNWNIHHITPRSKGGTNKPNNLALLHESCHKKLHKNKLEKTLKKNKQFKGETFMSTIRWALPMQAKKFVNDVGITFGHITNVNRNNAELEKTHFNDAFIIAGGNEHARTLPYYKKRDRLHNRCLQINRKDRILKKSRIKYPYGLGDLVWIGREVYESRGTASKGMYIYVKNPEPEDNNVLKGNKIRAKDVTSHFKINNWHLIKEKNNAVT